MTLIRTTIFAAAVALAATAAQAETRSFPATGFDRIGSSGPWDVSIATGKAASVRAEGATEDLDHMRIEVKDGRLEIGSKRGWSWKSWKRTGKVRVWVTMPSLRAVGLAGSGDVRVDRANAKAFKGSIAGSGNLSIGSLTTDSADFSIAGSGDISAAGKCSSADVSIAGSGSVAISGLLCQTLSASIAGSGDILAHATKTASISTVGSGDVTVTGGAKCSVKKAGSGGAHCS